MNRYFLLLIATPLLMMGCGTSARNQGADTDTTSTDTVNTPAATQTAATAAADIAVLGGIQAGQVSVIRNDDMLADNPELRFGANGQIIPSDPSTEITRDEAGRILQYTCGKLNRDTIGNTETRTYTYEGESYRVTSVLAERTTNQTTTKSYEQYSYDEGLNYPVSKLTMVQAERTININYMVYEYTRIDSVGNWCECNVKTYWWEDGLALGMDLATPIDDQAQSARLMQTIRDRMQDMTPTEYTESREIQYYQ